ncbi:hypothetical protein [Methanoregula formicica]|uniref:hypothetical protein n=1 Tax=Methanoregula formicica TaxID=882104 RepID=UPI00064FC105|nr:hypothetical protein [Methanoregula formicica]
MEDKNDLIGKRIRNNRIAFDKLKGDYERQCRDGDEIKRLEDELALKVRLYRMQSRGIDAQIDALQKEIEITESEIFAIPEVAERYRKNLAKMRVEKRAV